MRRSALLALCMLGCSSALAQPFPAEDTLDARAKAGRALFTQSCVVCHVKTQITAGAHFGPDLSGASLGGNEEVLRQFIAKGTPRMPGFQYQFAPAQIDALVAYVRSLPPPRPAAGKEEKP